MNNKTITPKIEAIIFDMDGLIFDSERVVKRSWDFAGKCLGLGPIGSQHIHHTLGFNVVRREQYFKGVFGKDFPMDKFNQIARKEFHKIADTEGIGMKRGIKELLIYAKEHRIKTAVATSSRREHSTALLRSADIWDYFDGAVFGDMVTVAKPDPEIYLKAAASIGVNPKNCIALEDSPAGILSSHAANMRPVMIPDLVEPTEEISRLCWRQCESLLEIIPLLECL